MYKTHDAVAEPLDFLLLKLMTFSLRKAVKD